MSPFYNIDKGTIIMPMNKRGLAILNAYSKSKSFIAFYERMKEELSLLGIELDKADTSSIYSYISSSGEVLGASLNYDFILFLDKDLYISRMLEERGFRLFNTARAIENCDDKMLTHLLLSNHGIEMPKTVSAPLCYSDDQNPDFLSNLEWELAYPFIAKGNYGSLGKEVTLVHNREELEEAEKRFHQVAHIYQKFISSSFGFDYRLIIINHHFVAGMKRQNTSGDFRSNIALGGIGVKTKLPKDYIEIAEKASVILGLDYCGVDLLQGDRREPVLCEVNSNAFLTGIEKTTGINVARAYSEHIAKTIYDI